MAKVCLNFAPANNSREVFSIMEQMEVGKAIWAVTKRTIKEETLGPRLLQDKRHGFIDV